jgi:tyrosine-protein kinase Etk/Wzc
LTAHKGTIGAATLVGAIAAAVAALLVPAIFTATAIIMPPQSQRSPTSALLGQIGAIASLGGADLGIKNPSDLYLGILKSRGIADALDARFELQKLYRQQTRTDTRLKLASRTHLEAGKDSLIRIAVDDESPERAASLANGYVEELYRLNKRLALTEASQRRVFFDQQIDHEKELLAQAEDAMRDMQRHSGVLQVNSQVDAVIRSMVQLRAEILAREVVLENLKLGATSRHPEVMRIEEELKPLRANLQKLESGSRAGGPGDPLIALTQVPGAGLEYTRRLRDFKYHEAMFEYLAKEQEVARLDEAKEAPIIQVVDTAAVPDKKSWPPRTLLVALGAAAAFLLTCCFVLFRRALRRTPQWSAVKAAVFAAPGRSLQ